MQSNIFLLVVLAQLLYNGSAVIRPKSNLSIINGQGFVAFLEVEPIFGNISRCWFQFEDGEKFEVNLNSNKTVTTIRGEEVRSFSSTMCGIRVNKVNFTSIGAWKLQAMNQSEAYTEGQVKINILAAPTLKFETIFEKPLGKETVSCTKQEYTRVCKLTNLLTQESWGQCDLYTMIRNESRYECRTLSWGSMIESIETITIRIAPNTQYSEPSLEETDDYYVLRCPMKSTSVQACRAEMPDRVTQFYVTDGLTNGRYSTYDTMSSQSKCALEIPKPLQHTEMGLWKIIQHSDSGVLGTGCLFYVGASSKETIIKEELKRQQDGDNNSTSSDGSNQDKESTTLLRRRRIQLYSTESTISEITCTVPFVVDDCYLRDPKNTVHFPDSGRFQRSRALGICTFINVQSMPGIWSCGLRGSDYKDDVVQDIEVFVESKLGRVVKSNVGIARHEPLELMCKSSYEEPISRCVYLDPGSRVHLVASVIGGTKSKGHVQYLGPGIENGFCGMRIDSVTGDDFGDWRCHFQVVNNGATVSNFTITVHEDVVSNASWYVILGITLAAIVAVAGLIALLILGYRKLRKTASESTSPVEAISMSVQE